MSRFLLDSLYLGGALAALPYLFVRGRAATVAEHLRRRLRPVPRRIGARPCLWLHGVSVGEVLSARRFLDHFTRSFDSWDVVVSATTRAGVEVARAQYAPWPVVSYPLDLSCLVRSAFDRIRPDLVLIVEHELWPNFLRHAQACGVSVVLVNARLSERSLRGYRLLSRFASLPLRGIELVCVEDERSARGFAALGVPAERIRVTGNLKFDNLPPRAQAPRHRAGPFPGGSWTLLAASTHAGEEDIVLEAFATLATRDPALRLVLAPRRSERAAEVIARACAHGFPARRWTEVAGSGDGVCADVVLVVDTVGELGTLYAAAQAVLVGGSLVPFGGHNVIEPAALGLPVLVGPHHDNFAGIVASFRARGALTVVRDAGELAVAVGALRAHPAACRAQGARALRTAQENSGASVRTLAALRGLVESVDATRSRAAEHRSGRMLEALPQLLNAAETAAPEVPPARSR